jgi:putative component of membrane protein insertase Oxa1/YidC/SpoIIIJ protein YidD
MICSSHQLMMGATLFEADTRAAIVQAEPTVRAACLTQPECRDWAVECLSGHGSLSPLHVFRSALLSCTVVAEAV